MNKDFETTARNTPGFNEWQNDYFEIVERERNDTISLLRIVLVAGSSILGFAVSLHRSDPECLLLQLLFLGYVIAFLFEIACALIALYGLLTLSSDLRGKLDKVLKEEVFQRKGYSPPITVEKKKKSERLIKTSLYSFFIGLFLLSLYSILGIFLN